jgi:hypothetical protein
VVAPDQRADSGGLVPGVTLHDGPRALEEGLGEPVGDRVLHEDAHGGEADLAGVVELLDGEVDGQVDVRVVQTSSGDLPPSSKDTGVMFAAAAAPTF